MQSMNKVPSKYIIQNKKALFDYEIVEEFTAGIILSGSEVKSIRLGQANLKGSYITLHSGKPILVGMHISPYKYNTAKILSPKRERELLMKQKEILYYSQRIKEMGSTLIPVWVFFKGNMIKIRVALARGRKNWKKKQLLKERDLSREVRKFNY